MSFRSAHREVGQVVRYALEKGLSMEEAATDLLGNRYPSLNMDRLDAASVAAAAEYGGGPGEASLQTLLATAMECLLQDITAFRARRQFYAEATLRLQKAVGTILN
jgi:argininosuccinate lyase